VVFGKKDNTNAVNLSSVVSGSGGFVINGEGTFAGRSHSGWVSSAGDVNGDGLDDLVNDICIGRAKHNERFTRLHLSVRACFISSNNQII
jgi:hypothetical protein